MVRAGLAPAVTGAAVLGRRGRRRPRPHPAHGGRRRFLRSSDRPPRARRGPPREVPLVPARSRRGGSAGGGARPSRDERTDAPAAAGADRERHERVRLSLDHPLHGELDLVFADQRTFGSLAVDALVATDDGEAAGRGTLDPLVPSQARHIARDPLDPAFRDRSFVAALSRTRSAIKRVLLDQGVVSGIGNIYADEALWSARLHPETPADAISSRRVGRLLAEVRAVLERALAEGGTSFDAQYVNVNGQAGYFAHSLNAYGRGGQPCPRCGRPIERIAFTNRASHFCPRCQRMPEAG